MSNSSANKTPTPSLSTRISKKITGKPVTIVSRIKQESIKTVTAEPESISTNPAVILPSSPTLIEVHIQFESAMDEGGVVTASDTAGHHRPMPQSAQIIEKLPVSMTTTASDVIKHLVEKHGGMVGAGTSEDLELFYLKQCTVSVGGEYRRVMGREESITECLEKQENGGGRGTSAGMSFHLCKQKPVNNKEANKNSPTEPNTTNKTQQQENDTNIVDGNIVEPYFFSPPHVSHVSDRNYRRRNSLPSYFTSTSANGQAGSKLSPTIRGSRTNKLQSLSEIMNQVVKETPQPLSAYSPPRRRQSSSDQSSPCRVRHLVSSPFVSPEKLYPKFVYTPGPGVNDKGSSAVQSSLFSDPISLVPNISSSISPDPNVSSPISPDPNASSPISPDPATNIIPPVYSLDTSIETHNRDATSSASPSLNDDPQSEPEKDEQCSVSGNNGDDNMHGRNETVESNNLETLSIESNPSEDWNETRDKSYETDSCNASQIDSPIEETPVSKRSRSICTSTSSTSTISASSLVSPARTSSLLDEATTHVLRRRSTEYIRSKAVSESDLGRPCLLFNKPPKSEISKQTSSPGLISVARHDMLLRRASQRVRDAREKRRSLLLETSDIKNILPVKESAKLPEQEQESDRSTDSIRDAELRQSTGIPSSGIESASFTGTSIQNTGTVIHSKLMPST